MSPARVEWYEGRAALAELAPAWDAVPNDCMPYSRSDWLLPWIDAFAGRRHLVLCTVWRGRSLVAGVAMLRAAGGRLVAPVNDHTPVFEPVFQDAESLDVLFKTVLAAAPGALRVAALPSHGAAVALIAAARAQGLRTHVETQHVSPFVDLTQGPASYRATAKHRLSEYERRRRKLFREHDVEVVSVERPVDLERHLDAGLALEAAGWKGQGGSAILSSPTTATFYREVACRYDGRDELRVSSLWVDGVMAAFDLALLSGGRYHLLKTAYDEKRRNLAPGMVLRLEVLDRCFALQLERHEFLGPDMPWKRVFANGERQHCGVGVFGHGLVGAATAAYRAHGRPHARSVYRGVRAWSGRCGG